MVLLSRSVDRIRPLRILKVKSRERKVRLVAIVSVPIVVAMGLGLKWYTGPGRDFVNNWGPASVAYELLFMLLAFACVPKRRAIGRIAIGVFVGTCLIEFSQLLQWDWLNQLRSYSVARLVLGSSFSWWDFPAYAVGCLLGVLLLRGIHAFATGQNDQANADHGDH